MAIQFTAHEACRHRIYHPLLTKAAEYEMISSSRCAKARNHAQHKTSLEGRRAQALRGARREVPLHGRDPFRGRHAAPRHRGRRARGRGPGLAQGRRDGEVRDARRAQASVGDGPHQRARLLGRAPLPARDGACRRALQRREPRADKGQPEGTAQERPGGRQGQIPRGL